MVVGKIKWFGGKNSKINKVNDCGYISVDNYEEDVKVFRNDVPLELQELFEKDREKGEGYLVEFDVQDFKDKNKTKKKAVNLKPVTSFGLVTSLRELISQENISFTINQINLSNKGKVVEFMVRNNNVHILRQVSIDELSEEVVKAFSENGNYQIAKIFIHQYLLIVNDLDRINFVLNKLKNLNTQEITDLFDLVCTNYEHLFLISDELRQQLKNLEIARYRHLLENNLWSADEDTQRKLWLEFVHIIHSSNESRIIFELLQFYLCHVDTRSAISFIENKITVIEENKIKEFLRKSFEYSPNAFLESQSLHPYLRDHHFSEYLDIVQRVLESDNQSVYQSVIQYLVDSLKNCSSEKAYLAWRKIAYLENHLEYNGYLWDIAPLEYKRQLIEKRYAEFFALVKEFENSDYPYSQYISKNYKELYDFDNNDKELARLWGNNTTNDFEKAKMLSARGAEKLVQYFYRNLGSDVEDIAVHQIGNKSELWRKADIYVSQDQAQSKEWIDVKNARKAVNSNVYSEFCIPRFKEERGQDVIIAAVLSPYLQFQYMNRNGANFYIDNPQYLGELRYSQLQSLTQGFSDSVVRLDMTRGFDPNSYLAPWLFDYNAQFYQNQIKIANKFCGLPDDAIPSQEDIELLDNNSIYNYLPLFIYGNKQLPSTWYSKMPQWLREFVILLYRKDDNFLKLPDLYMAILKNFLINLYRGDSLYSPNCILNLVGNENYPFKIYDPLGIIKDFCQTLQIVWDNKQHANLTGFKIFKFDGRGLLSGKHSADERHSTTILAFCGGWIERQGKCGHSPLVIGREVNCHICGKLICSQGNCGYCSSGCPGYGQRRQRDQGF